jgi:hypothetical protein
LSKKKQPYKVEAIGSLILKSPLNIGEMEITLDFIVENEQIEELSKM